MIEEIPSGQKPEAVREEEKSPEQTAEGYLAAQAVPVWEGGVTGDFINAVVGPANLAGAEPLWPKIKPVGTIEQYVEKKVEGAGVQNAAEISAAIVKKINTEFLTKANAIIANMNVAIGTGVTSEEQADTLLVHYQAFEDLLRRRQG